MTGPAARLWVKLLLVPATPRWADPREVGAIAWTFGANTIVHAHAPDATHVPANLLAAAGVLGFALSAGASLDELGLEIEDLRRATHVGLVATAAIAGGVPGSRPRSPRPADTSPTAGSPRSATHTLRTSCSCAYRSAPRWRRNPVLRPRSPRCSRNGTRGGPQLPRPQPCSDCGTSCRRSSRSIRIRSASGSARVAPRTAPRQSRESSPRPALAGVAFSWLQRHAHSVLAPVLAHAVLNGSTYAAGRVLARTR